MCLNYKQRCLIFLFRFWLFSDVVPGLYIEKGWVHESIDYSFTPPPEDKPAEPEEDEAEDGESAATQDSLGAKLFSQQNVCYNTSDQNDRFL